MEATVQSLVNVLDYGMSVSAAVDTGQFMRRPWNAELGHVQVVGQGELSAAVLQGVRALGQEIYEAPPSQHAGVRGIWIGIRIDPKTGRLEGGASRFDAGGVAGY
jgi:gamma-glutamyltranspeptidase